MNTVDKARSPLHRQLKAYEETWKRDHQDAMACRDWEDALAVGVNIFRHAAGREQAWRDQVFRGTVAFADKDDLEHRGRFAMWLNTTREVLTEILPGLETRFGTVAGADALRRCASLAEKVVREWQPPRLARAVGLREVTLSPEAAAELDRIVDEANRNPPPMPARRMEARGPDFLLPERS